MRDIGDEIEDCVAVMRDGFLRDSFDLPFVIKLSNVLLNGIESRLPEARCREVKARIFDMVFQWQQEKPALPQPEWQPAPAQYDDDFPWQQREPWATIKTYLPPAMIDTPEKERKVAWRIGYLMGYGAVEATAAAIREYGLTGGIGLVALLGWICGQIRRR